ncbi:MAG TPA: glycoside hydrolase domain-containing protein [Candidatus Cybelea sp.]|nr:glycoside hydrolase domain-containing protein [Candidatus Cybelea sp.]
MNTNRSGRKLGRTARKLPLLVLGILFCGLATEAQENSRPPAYLGFDANDYPGDVNLPRFRPTFAFVGYWLNNPPASAPPAPGNPSADLSRTEGDSWLGHRRALAQQGFGFLVLFNGRFERELKSVGSARTLGAHDAGLAASTAVREGFPPGTAIFVDQEEGGSMNDAQMAYLLAWFDGVAAAGFRAGIYCSAIPAREGGTGFAITADYVRDHAGARDIVYFVYDDVCPPAPGCTYSKTPPSPSASGVPFASVWQFAQSPRRRQFTRRCASTYSADGNCYAPGTGPGSAFIDLESARSPDPSRGR